MKLLILSRPDYFPEEASIIRQLFERGLKLLHLRKTEGNDMALYDLISRFPSQYYDRIVLHQHHHLVKHFKLKRIHYKEKDRTLSTIRLWNEMGVKVSSSFHSEEDLCKYQNELEYGFLSPFFDSISKDLKGFYDETIALKCPQKTVALGGISVDTITQLKGKNLYGVAVLGGIWQSQNPLETFEQLKHEVES